jgi:hypothetical protein
VTDESISRNDLGVPRDGPHDQVIRVLLVDPTLIGAYRLPDGGAAHVADQPAERYRLATADEVHAAEQRGLLPPAFDT